MFKLDEQILRAYFRMEEAERQRLWLARLLHPETFEWAKRGAPPPITATKLIRIEELEHLGFGEAHYQRMVTMQEEAKLELANLIEEHILWPHFLHIKGFAHRMAGSFVAAGGDITRAPTVSAFWKGMGLDVLPDGSVPRRVRGRKDIERRVPALPHVTKIGEQIRLQLLRSGGLPKELYDRHKADYRVRYPAKPLMYAHKHGQRIPQKIFYACLWREWRLGYNLPAPEPYAFAILKHDSGEPIRITDFYSK